MSSRAFGEFAESRLADRVHETLLKQSHEGQVGGHVSRDSRAIQAREKPPKKKDKACEENKPKKRGRPKGTTDQGTDTPGALDWRDGPLAARLDDLPNPCDVGTKKNSKGYQSNWPGHKPHMDAADGVASHQLHGDVGLQPRQPERDTSGGDDASPGSVGPASIARAPL
jgi:hypothetical protein